MARYVRKQKRKRQVSREEEQGEHLLPGLPDEITVNHIVTQLTWQDLHILPSLSRGWREVIQSRQLYDARVHHHTTETLVVLDHKSGPTNFFVLYSVRDRSCYCLPSMSEVHRGIPSTSQFIASKGKIYVLGGVHWSSEGIYCLNEKVYVLDLVGQRQWKQCASMLDPKMHFGCGVLDGKLYVIGGSGELDSLRGGALYDPKEDAWSPITPMPSICWKYKVATIGEELFVYSGDFSSQYGRMYSYHPLKNEWRNFGRKGISGTIFVANGKFHSLTSNNVPWLPMSNSCQLVINVFNMHSKSWTQVHSSTYTECISGRFKLQPRAVLKVDDELLALVYLIGSTKDSGELHLLQSKGFGTENKEIMWEKISLPIKIFSSMMCAVEL